MKKIVQTLIAAPLLCAQAAHAEGLYLSAGAGASVLQDADNTNDSPRVDVKSTYDPGWAVIGAVGYGFANGLRLEAEAGFRQVSLDELDIEQDGGLGAALGLGSVNGLTVPADGRESALSVMGNVWYDIGTGTPLTPYVGGGIGLARIALDDVKVSGVTIIDDRDTVFAYQLGAGAAYALTPKVSLTLDYRFFGTADGTFTDITGDFRSEFYSHSLMGGMRIGF